MSADDQQTSSSGLPEPLSIDVGLLKEIAKKDLVDALNSVNGAKTLVLDPSLAGPLGLITEVALLKHHGVDKMFWLEPGPVVSSTPNIVYLCRPKVNHMKVIADQVKRHTKEFQKHTYTLLLVPRVSTLAKRILEEEGVLGDITVVPYNLQFIPLADDVISLENDQAFRELWIDGDETVVFDSAQALHTLQKLYGLFPWIVGKGDYASQLSTLLTRQGSQSTGSTPETLQSPSQKVDSLIILDRRVDMITPLLTQLTYEGLIDELMGIKNSHVEVPISLLNPTAANASASTSTGAAAAPPATTLKKETKKKHLLTAANDPLFTELRDLNFSSVGRRLNKVAHRLEEYKSRLQSKTVAQLKEFVGRIGGLQAEHQSLRLHIGLSELLIPLTRTDEFNKSLEVQQNLLASYEVSNQISAVEDMIAQGADIYTVLRLLCLASITVGGIKTKTLENLKKEILQAYGYHYLPLLLSLGSPGMPILLPNPLPTTFPAQVASVKYPFTSVRKSLRLLIDDNPEALEEVENDISYTYSGYAPISIRLIQCVAQKGGVLSNPAEKEKSEGGKNPITQKAPKAQAHPIMGWKGFEDIVNMIPGGTVDLTQGAQASKASKESVSNLLRLRDHSTTTVVFFLGGCTYTEIAALRWVARQNQGRSFLIATTGIVTGSSLLQTVAEGERSNASATRGAQS